MALIQAFRFAAGSLRERIKEAFHRTTERNSPTDGAQYELTDPEIAAYFRSVAAEWPKAELVEDRTWSDLEMERVFIRLNKSTTPLGAQHLYAMLRHAQSNPELLNENVIAIHAFTSNPEAGAALRRVLRELGRSESAELAGFLPGKPPAVPSWHRLFYFLSAVAVLCPFGLFLSPWFLLPSLCLWIINIVVHCVYRRDVVQHASALANLATLVGCARQIPHALRRFDLPEVRELRTQESVARKIQQQISKTFLSKESANDLLVVLVENLNVLCLFELCSLCRAILAVNKERAALLRIFQIIGRLDAFQGLSTALGEYPVICAAELKAGRDFTLLDVYHPLVANPVPNSIEGSGHSLLLTGTNMAGKTTFIKTLGINLLLAQTLGICLARKAVLPPARLKTLINREDTILAGQSYFFFEASELRRMLDDAKRTDQEAWFVLDEVFRGTNTIERVAAAAAVLGHLARQGMVIASTHDHELTTLLAAQFDAYHFSEVVDGGRARFDYQLRKGPCTSRNAIKLLALAGYPQDVIEAAEKLATSADRRLSPIHPAYPGEPVAS